jgi:DnaK suppressor protein
MRRLSSLERRPARGRRRAALEAELEEAALEEVDPVDEALRCELAQIRAALWRMEQETFGTCQGCGRHIPLSRLREVPTAVTCPGCVV